LFRRPLAYALKNSFEGNIAEKATDMRTILVAAIFSGCIFLFILLFFCFTFKSKLDRKKQKTRRRNAAGARSQPALRQRQPYRSQKPMSRSTAMGNSENMDNGRLTSPVASRFVYHDITAVTPLQQTAAADSQQQQLPNEVDEHTFYG
jgi:hypothetical protein